MDENELAPLTVSCPLCGSPAEDFDIIRQEYHCRRCGGAVSAREAKLKFDAWAQEHLARAQQGVAARNADGVLSCTGCGAPVPLTFGDDGDELATSKCSYCGTQIVAAPPGRELTLPDVMIPFFITLDEAKERLREWCAKNSSRPEARAVLEHIDTMRGCYLPYEVVKGPIRFEVSRDSSKRVYTCGGYLNGTAVSTSLRLHNPTLDAVEPFDWTGARPYDHGYIMGQTVKLRDTTQAETDKRVTDEVAAAYLPTLEQTLMSKGINFTEVFGGGWIRASTLLPVYILDVPVGRGRHAKTIHAAVNGQTGRVAVESAKPREIGRYWFLKPVSCTAAFGVLAWYLASGLWFTVEIALLFGILFYIILAKYRTKRHTRERVLRGDSVCAKRTNGRELSFASGDSLPPPTAPPVFFEVVRGTETPVELKFYVKHALLPTIFMACFFIFAPLLPWALTGLLSLFKGTPVAPVKWFGGSGWFFVVGPLVPIALLRYFWRLDEPIFKEILPDGSSRVVPPADIGRDRTAELKRLRQKREASILLGSMLFLLLGSLSVPVRAYFTKLFAPAEESAPTQQQRLAPLEAFRAHVPDFGAQPIGTAFDAFFDSPTWDFRREAGKGSVEFHGTLHIDGSPRPVLMLFDVTEYVEGGSMQMRLASMSWSDTKETVREDLADKILRAPFNDNR